MAPAAASSLLIATGWVSVDSEADGAPGNAYLAGAVETETGFSEIVGGAGFAANASSPFFSGSAESEVSVRGGVWSSGLHETQ